MTTRQRGKTKTEYAALGLTTDDLLQMYYKIILTRAVDERAWILNRQGKAPFIVSCQGQEAAQIGSAYAIKKEVDFVYPYYRDLALVLTLGVPTRELMLSILSKAGDPFSGARQTPGHFSYPPLRIITGSSPVATQIPQAAGTAYAAKLWAQRNGQQEMAATVVYFGDGATSKGDFHEGLNFAGVYRLPVVFFCENNEIAISVPQEKQMAIKDVSIRAQGYGFPGVTIDGTDVLTVYSATQEALERARHGEGPTLIEAKVHRFMPHSSDDDDRRYGRREKAEEEHKLYDPAVKLRAYLEEAGILTATLAQELQERAAQEVDEATDFAERAPYPRPEEALTHVYLD